MTEGSPESQYRCEMDILIPKDMDPSKIQAYIKDHIFIKGWSGAFCTNFLRVKNLSFIANSAIAVRQQEPGEIFGIKELSKYMYARAEELQNRGDFNSAFECLYLVTVINRGWYWDTTGRHRIRFTLESLKGHDAAIAQATREDVRKKVLDEVERALLEVLTPEKLSNLLRATTPAPGNRTEPEKEKEYQCGDECHGECSGEYDGRIHCPVSEAEQRIADVIAELEKRTKNTIEYENASDHMLSMCDGFQEAISLLKNGVK